MYKRAVLGMLAVLLTILMTGPYACMKIDMIKKYGSKSEKQIVFTCEPAPEFPGGEEAMASYIKDHLNYPELAAKSAIGGTVLVNFMVTETGAIDEVKVLKGVGSGGDEEAIRLVRNMPAWKSVITSGRAVATNFNLPINFKLPD